MTIVHSSKLTIALITAKYINPHNDSKPKIPAVTPMTADVAVRLQIQ